MADHFMMRIGSAKWRLAEPPRQYRLVLESLFRAIPFDLCPSDEPCDLEIYFRESEKPFGHDDGYRVSRQGEATFFATRLVGAVLGERQLKIEVAGSALQPNLLSVYLHLILNGVLRKLQLLRLHAAAFLWEGRTHMFLGPNGAGKSTLSVWAAQAGAVLLAEDQVVVRRDHQKRYWIAGGDARLRLARDTEQRFFPTPLRVTPQDFGGRLKKEVPLSDCVAAACPFQDYPPHRLYWLESSPQFELTRQSRGATVCRLLQEHKACHRFSDQADRLSFVDFLSGFAESLECYQLRRSPRFEDLDLLLGSLE